MDLDIKWHPGLPLEDGTTDGLIYTISSIDIWQGRPGIYMFCRTYGECLIPLYIGRSNNIGRRAQQHLESTRMMKAIQASPKGLKTFVIGELIPRRGQQVLRALKIAEKTLIEHALTQGYELINKSGTKPLFHSINYTGHLLAKTFSGSVMYTKASR